MRQLSTWQGEFGNAYTDRNVVPWESRVDPFREMIGGLPLARVLEVGCNRGHNLRSIRSVLGEHTDLIGIEPNRHALGIARQDNTDCAVLWGNAFDLPFKDGYFDLVFTLGVLEHIALQDIPAAMKEIARVSRRYILAVEYFAEEETTIHYRGSDDLLWKRNFLRHYEKNVPGLRVLRNGYWAPDSPINDANWWLFEKPEEGAGQRGPSR